MAEATLDSPHTLDPRQAVKLRVRAMQVDHVARVVGVTIDYVDAGGVVIHTVQRQLSGAQVQTWIANQEATILSRFLAAEGLTGTVA
jgi:uncharacterized lipoprotein YmbA